MEAAKQVDGNELYKYHSCIDERFWQIRYIQEIRRYLTGI